MKITGRYKQKGNLVAAAVIIIVGLGAFGLSVIRTVSSTSVSSGLALQGYQTMYLAKSALEYGSYMVRNNIDVNNPAAYCDGAWKTTQTFGAGEFHFKCTRYVPSITVTAAITAGGLVIPVSSLTSVAPLGRVQIDSEQIDYSDTSTSASVCGTAPCLVVKKRGGNNTTAASHSVGASATQTQLVVEVEGAVPTLANPTAKKVLQKAIGLTASTYTNGWAVGQSGSVFRRTNNQWQPFSVSPSTSNNFNSVSCSSSTDCWIAGDNKTLYRWNGTSWTQYVGANIAGTNTSLKKIRCTGSNNCWLITNNQNVYSWNGTSWSLSTTLGETLSGLSCVGSNFCIVVGGEGLISKWNGTSWSSMSSGTSQDLLSVSCPSASICFATGTNGKILKMSSSSWSSQTSPITKDLLTVSCADVNNCWAFGTNRDRNAQYSNGTWQTKTVAISNKQINNVFCVNYNQCFLAVNRLDANDALVGKWDGVSWGNDSVQSGSAQNLYSVTADNTASTVTHFENIAWREVFN